MTRRLLTHSVRPEPVEGPYFFYLGLKEGQGFELSSNGLGMRS